MVKIAQVMHQLIHNGILIPKQKSILEEMVESWARKLETPYVQDPKFRENFFHDFRFLTSLEPETHYFFRVKQRLDAEKQAKLNWSAEQKKSDRLQRKALAEQNKQAYGYAIVDGVRTEVANYRAEPAGIFMGRGAHPKRGSWKQAVAAEEVILNLSPDAPMPSGFSKRVWEPSKCYTAKWRDKFSGKIK